MSQANSSNKKLLQRSILKWLDGKLPVPKVIAHEKQDGMTYLLMTRINGKMSCDETFLSKPDFLISKLANALQMLWETDIALCPVIRDTDTELKEAWYRIENNFVDIDNTEPETFGAGDRYRDIALCYRSLKHNTDGTFGDVKYGMNPDMDKIRWYLLLDELF